MNTLDVLANGRLIGHLHDTTPLSFSYTEDCLGRLVQNPIERAIPLEAGKIATPAVFAYFENLLPEGYQRTSLEAKHHVSTVFGLLAQAGWDTAGQLVLRPSGTPDTAHSYTKKSWSQIADVISGREPLQELTHASISGAQFKLLLSLSPDGYPLLPLADAPTTHILKPDIQRNHQTIWASAINETLMMKTAARCRLPTADVSYIGEIHSCLVRRYDRREVDGAIVRLSQADLCQLLKTPSNVKYENDGGPDFASCYNHVKSESAAPIADCENLIKWVFFNICTGNNDSHAKNISMLMTDEGYRLAPFYDLTCTAIYPEFSRNFAFKIGGTYKMGELSRQHLKLFSESVGASDKYVAKLAAEIAKNIPEALEESIAEITKIMGPNEATMAERLALKIHGNCKKFEQRVLGYQQSATEGPDEEGVNYPRERS